MAPKSAQPPADRRIAALAERQHGVVSFAQLRRAGLGPDAIKYRLRIGRLHAVQRGVYSVGHRVISGKARWLAAVLACGEGAALSHRSAAALWGIRPSATPVVDVTVPTRAGRRQRVGIVIHRASLPPGEVTVRSGIPVTTPPARLSTWPAPSRSARPSAR